MRYNAYNRRLFSCLHREALAGRGVMLSLTESYRRTPYGEPIVALKCFVLSPFVDEHDVRTTVQEVLEAREKIRFART